MDKSAAHVLNSLVPGLNEPFPAELVELARALLVESRGKASSLKADEEIARSYACSNLACERLKKSLALPKIQPRPPCPPRVYQKLYRFLDATLLAGTRRSNRVPALNKPALTPKKSPLKPTTPVKVTLKQGTLRNRAPRQIETVAEVPEWVMPAVRLLCQKLGAPAAPHHIFAGVSSILTLSSYESNNKEKSADSLKNIPALIMVVLLTVYIRLAAVEITADECSKLKKAGFAILQDYLGQEMAQQDINDADFGNLILKTKESGWREMDWFENIIPGAGLSLGSAAEEANEEGSKNEEIMLEEDLLSFHNKTGSSKGFLQAGLGTMMQDKVDYLSETRRLRYQDWEKGILIKIRSLEQVEH